MPSIFEDQDVKFHVVVNHEEQFSIWPTEKEIPGGWRDTGFSGNKTDCLEYIEEVWTDMRPLSLRKAMEPVKKPAKPKKAATRKTAAATRKKTAKKGT